MACLRGLFGGLSKVRNHGRGPASSLKPYSQFSQLFNIMTFGLKTNISMPGHEKVNISMPGHEKVNISIPGHEKVDISMPGHEKVNISMPRHEKLTFQ